MAQHRNFPQLRCTPVFKHVYHTRNALYLVMSASEVGLRLVEVLQHFLQSVLFFHGFLRMHD